MLTVIALVAVLFIVSDTSVLFHQAAPASHSSDFPISDNGISHETGKSAPHENPPARENSEPPADNEQLDELTGELSYEQPDELPDAEPVPDWVGKVNGFNINFDRLIKRDAGNGRLVAMHEYFASLEPGGQNEKTGIFEGYNLITISAEALTSYAIDPELTPTLYKMQHEGFYFENYYAIYGGGTISGELGLISGLAPQGGHRWCNNAARKYMPFSFASQFNALGIQPYAYHNGTYTFYDRNIMFPNLGYIFRARRQGMDFRGPGWHMSDKALIELSIDQYIDEERFYVHYMTVSGHSPYGWENGVARQNRAAVDHLRYSTSVKAYLATQMELEYAMEYLLERLEEKGIAERTLIVMTTDHYPYGLTTRENAELAGQPFDSDFGMHKNACIIYVKGMEPETISAPSFTPDIVPTVSNLLGLPFDSRFLSGRDVFSDEMPLVFLACGFITDAGYYERRRGKFTPFDGAEVPEGYISEISDIVNKRKTAVDRIIELNYFTKIADYLVPPFEILKWREVIPE